MIREVLPNLYCVEIPLPRSPLGNLNSYFIKAEDRYLIVDTGWNCDECHHTMDEALKRLNVNLKKTDFFITHIHDDHLGLVGKLATGTSRVFFNKPEAAIVNTEHLKVHWDKFGTVYRSHGFPEKELQRVMSKHPSLLYNLNQRCNFRILKENDILSIGDYSFRCLETPGHSPGHICLYEPKQKILISGDHILDTITPNIGYWPELDNPLKEYLASLEKVSQLDVDVVLPAHRNIFHDLPGRIAELKEHHAARLTEILDSLDGCEKCAYQVAPDIKWDIDYSSWAQFPPTQKWFAMGETIAHLKHLEALYKIRRRNDGKIVFSLV